MLSIEGWQFLSKQESCEIYIFFKMSKLCNSPAFSKDIQTAVVSMVFYSDEHSKEL